MDTIQIGDFKVKRIGLGTNKIRNDQKSKKALLKAALLGINFFDTASAYTGGESEEAIGDTLSVYYPKVVISTKGGMKAPDFKIDGRPENLKVCVENSLRKLKLSQIPLYFLHRVDPNVPLKESVMFLKKMQEVGKIKYLGLSEVSVEQLEEAGKYIEVISVQNQYNLLERKHEDVLNYCEKNNIVFIPWTPISHGSINIPKDLLQKYQATPTQLALAWLLHRSKVMLPIPGSTSPDHIEENFNSLKIDLTSEDFKKLSNI